jgi:predicted nucleic-acid-binding protein
MIALDTNVLVRLVTNDDPKQAKLAARLIDSNKPFFVPLTVSLELEWVLRGAYRLDRDTIAHCFESLLAIRNVSFEVDASVVQAIGLYQSGFDFADALHLASSARCDELATFDHDFYKKSKRLKTLPTISRIDS